MYIKELYKGEFIPAMQGWLNISKSVNIIYHINLIKRKNCMIISIDAEKTSDKIQHLFLTKTIITPGTVGYFLI